MTEQEDKNFEKQARKAIGYAVMVMDNKKGVHMGYLREVDGRTCTLEHVRMCVRWTSAEGGILGLASVGPGPGCRISHPVEEQVVTGVHSLATVTEEAWDRWESRPWG